MRKPPAPVACLAAAALLGSASAACSDLTAADSESDAKALVRAEEQFGSSVSHYSTKSGGTLRLAKSGGWESFDPANLRSPYARNFARNYSRTLVVFKAVPGSAQLVPDLAEGLGVASDGGKTWTYKLRGGLLFEDGSRITSKDVKYGVERALDRDVFPNGPRYFNELLDLRGYAGPDRDSDPSGLGLRAVDTPDDRTIVFRLARPVAAFDYFAQLPATIPVPRAKDTGRAYSAHVVSSGPYKFAGDAAGATVTLVRNDHYSQKLDPDSGRRALPDKIQIETSVPGADLDQRLLSGAFDVDASGRGIHATLLPSVLANESLKDNLVRVATSELRYTYVNPDVGPLDNVHCRIAILMAADRTAYRDAYGGPLVGDLATSVLAPDIRSPVQPDIYRVQQYLTGDPGEGGVSLKRCGRRSGFEATVAYRDDQPADKAAAESLKVSLGRIGIALTLHPMSPADYEIHAGDRDYLRTNGIGLVVASWQKDWPTGFNFLGPLVDSRSIGDAGSVANLGVRLPAVDTAIDVALRTQLPAAREQIWADMDRDVMLSACLLPALWGKAVLYHPDNLTNVFVSSAFGMFDLTVLGTTRK